MLRQQGFTIVELIAVIIIIGIMSSVAAPRFVGNDAFETRGVHGKLLASLRLAQRTAVAQRRPVFTRVNVGLSVVCVAYSNSCDAQYLVTDPATSEGYIYNLPNTVTITTSLQAIRFTGSGLEVNNNPVTITVQNNNNPANMRTIKIEADTGYVH